MNYTDKVHKLRAEILGNIPEKVQLFEESLLEDWDLTEEQEDTYYDLPCVVVGGNSGYPVCYARIVSVEGKWAQVFSNEDERFEVNLDEIPTLELAMILNYV